MITITNQSEFDKIFVTNLSTLPQNEIIRIMLNKTGFYNVNAPIVITKSNVIIQGYGKIKPKLKYIGASQSADTGVLNFTGTSGNELENIIVENLDIDGVDKSKSKVHGIYCGYVGKAPTAGKSGGGYDSTTVGINVINKKGITVKDCIIQNNANYGIYLDSSSNNTITGNTCQNNSNGIYLNSSSNNTVTGNTCQNNSAFGISLNSSSNNNTITGNTCQNNDSVGISLQSSSNNNTITGNTYQNNNYGIYLHASSNNTITGNTCQNNSNGIYLNSSSNNNTITGNTCQNNNSNGIYLISSNANVIMSNTITQSSGAHISSAGTFSLILGNIMTGAGTGITSTGANSKVVDNIKI